MKEPSGFEPLNFYCTEIQIRSAFFLGQVAQNLTNYIISERNVKFSNIMSAKVDHSLMEKCEELLHCNSSSHIFKNIRILEFMCATGVNEPFLDGLPSANHALNSLTLMTKYMYSHDSNLMKIY